MILQLLKKQRKYILIDIDTQRDYLLAEGKARINNHNEVLINIRRMIAWARYENVPVISTAEVHYNNPGVIRHCIEGTEGQRKINYTLLSNRISFPADDWNALPADLLLRNRQIILHKRCSNPFDEPRIERLFSELEADEFILIGAGTENAVEATALGLLQRGKKVKIITDAVGSHNKRRAKLALRKMEAKGALLIETKDFAGTSHLRSTAVCMCEHRLRKVKSKRIALKKDYGQTIFQTVPKYAIVYNISTIRHL